MTVTVITLLKRREGMSKTDFIAYYEENHRRIGESVLAGRATRYVRRFLHPLDGEDRWEDADVVMEIDFADEAARDACFAALAQPAMARMIAEDEARLFDRNRIRSFAVEERRSEI
ncbi:EthD domain-containing protein [Novosphingobium sp. G106]|uniref:EthD domain-containing protein n=1 Tax=Novosphingobium sp. G106 TaxID=2849500 RepID=UPI001C2DD7B2|nr:EthD domain-containing protein [Novosphingobium sp. G106]MBV1691067.1 EthD domain-containing protein [Novosphingobium sp. G106]